MRPQEINLALERMKVIGESFVTELTGIYYMGEHAESVEARWSDFMNHFIELNRELVTIPITKAIKLRNFDPYGSKKKQSGEVNCL